jgi:hypothetical protein
MPGEACPFPMRRALRPLESSRPCAHHGPRHTGSVSAADNRSIGGARRTRASRGRRATTASLRSCPRQRKRATPI